MSHAKPKEYWLPCPVCKGKTRTRVHEDTALVNFPLFCPKCKSVTRINFVKLNMVRSDEPDV
ncbi:MAG: cysteine-rich KTR domain-containing protein [Oscillospiraceae bacterium]|nr:cysteine-rich KTR domain-containing protein [Oscillospiraceae bacterium]